MNLNDQEKRILDGGDGAVARKCMEFLVAYGEVAGAEKLVDIDGTVDMHPGTHWVRQVLDKPGGDRGAWQSGREIQGPDLRE